MNRLLRATVLPALAAGLVAGLTVASPSVAAEKPPLRYVALGDSYSAASGVLPIDLSSVACLRSTRNYPKVIARTTGASLKDVTCGAADTGDFFTAQHPGLVPPQLDALKADTELVTMTIGGNDSSVFLNAILTCSSSGLSTLGRGSPCKDKFGSQYSDTIKNTTYPDIVKALKAVRAKSPKARVAILGYPEIVPPTGGCFPQLPLAKGDVPYLHGIQGDLNSAVKRAARATGATYVDFAKVSVGHDACQRIGTRWVEPVILGTNPVIVHPNALGEAKMAEQAIKVLGLS